MKLFLAGLMATVCAASASAQTTTDLAEAFGAREAISGASLSPDGTKIAFLGPANGKGRILYTFDVTTGTAPKAALTSTGDIETISSCGWVSNLRLACKIRGLVEIDKEIFASSRMIALDSDGRNVTSLSKSRGENAVFGARISLDGGSIIDWGTGADDRVLMTRVYVPESSVGTLIEKKLEGLGVDQIDTRTLKVARVETPRKDADEYITDGSGDVRIVGIAMLNSSGYEKGQTSYSFRLKGSREWKPLGVYDYVNGDGFNPYAVDSIKDVVYGFIKINGRQALVSRSLASEALVPNTVLARPDVDVDGLIRIGKKQRVVGASFATERRESVYFDPVLSKLALSLGKALPGQPLIEFVDSSADESRLLLWAGGDTVPGTYYLFDKATKKLQPIMPARPELATIKLASVQPVRYPASDGTMIPGYLTLPPGSSGKNLPTIVIPHGGPSARDEWGFDWFSQYYVSRGFAVLQPNFRGSSGYGETWYRDNGFKSWRIVIGDVEDAGHWLVKTGVADPKRLYILGWSYGGYAALQSAVVEPGLYKAVVAVAPVTDLETAKNEWRDFSNRRIQESVIGTGPHIKEGSPAQNADRISVPVLLFHGTLDRNVRIAQSRLMAKQLRDAGKRVELVEYPKLEHSLVDSKVRAEMLKRSADFLLAAAPQ